MLKGCVFKLRSELSKMRWKMTDKQLEMLGANVYTHASDPGVGDMPFFLIGR